MMNVYKFLARKRRAKWPFERLKCVFKDNTGVKYIARETESEGVDTMQLAHNMNQYLTTVNTSMVSDSTKNNNFLYWLSA
jgi:hypothetical protein